ncbi:hypothetical protein H4R21_003820 [Coemansia helicoidea]|uniref:Uncharacterized protein n=1 Tax=Coemansia helicoidea TaxID=1286919 RepID=A0ACC1L0Q6_9FUNG|nr:hypothetical protein H4R21_003820 [Coemansia helicoidea]
MSPLSKAQMQRQAEQLVDFVNKGPSPFHVVDVCRNWLRGAQFTELKEKQSWSGAIKPNGRYFFTRNGSSIVAFAVGGKFVSAPPAVRGEGLPSSHGWPATAPANRCQLRHVL